MESHIDGSDTLIATPSYSIISHSGQQATQTFAFSDLLGGGYRGRGSSANDVVTGYSGGQGRPGPQNRVLWFIHPDGSPYQADRSPNW